MFTTSLSTASVVTNMKVGGGGAYFLLSRSLGIEIGGAIGITLVLSRMISLALVVTGFSYSITNLFPNLSVYLVELVTMVALLIITLVSTNLALKTQQLIFWVLSGSIVSVFFFTIPTENPLDLRFYKEGLTFWQGFAIFFPAFTGIEAGMALSGSLRNPSRSLAFGNIWSVDVSSSCPRVLPFYSDYPIQTALPRLYWNLVGHFIHCAWEFAWSSPNAADDCRGWNHSGILKSNIW